MEKMLTIVVPSYNVENYLEKTLDSFIAPELENTLEVLVVNDGSKDRTPEIAKKYEMQYPGIFRLINKENGGHGSTINRGIENAQGKYFKVVDGDDWVKTDQLIQLVLALSDIDTEFVMTDYSEVNDKTLREKRIAYPMLTEKPVWSIEEIVDLLVIPMHPLVIRTDILQQNQIRMTEHCFYVDNEYTTFPIPYVNQVTYIPLNVYMYRLALVTQSVSMSGFQKHIEDHKKVVSSLLSFVKKCRQAKITEAKIRYIVERTSIMVATQAGIYASFPLKAHKKKEFQAFDQMIRRIDVEVYQISDSKSHLLHYLRKYNFKGYLFWVTLSKIRARF